MFPPETYIARRTQLRQTIRDGVILFLGNDESPINYADNYYPFRQDSSFLYYFGLDIPHIATIIDIDENNECIFGDDITVDEIVWQGPRPALNEISRQTGIYKTNSYANLRTTFEAAIKKGRRIHFLPPYRVDMTVLIAELLHVSPSAVHERTSVDLVKAVIAQRSVKDKDEITQLESAVVMTGQMQILAMKSAKPGRYEREVAGAMEGLVLSKGLCLAFPTIFTIHGQTLHQNDYSNQMRPGDIVINDCGAESIFHYAGDITRTIPVSGKFSPRQSEIYDIVLNAQQRAIRMIKPAVEFRDVHRCACIELMAGLEDLALVKGDPEEIVHSGAHTLFFPCGVGHMLGLDVHDMEALGEDYIGYNDAIKRNPEFGWKWLRLAKSLEPGYVVTVEPGIYFIPELIDRWKAEQKCTAYINYAQVEKYRDFGGIRIEDDVIVTQTGCRVLGEPIPKSIVEVEAACSPD